MSNIKKILAIMLAYIIILSNVSIEVFANSNDISSKFKYKDTFYATSALQYKDKTLVSGYEKPYEGEFSTFLVDEYGNKNIISSGNDEYYHFHYIDGNTAKTTDETKLELGAYDSWSQYSYNFETGEISEIIADKEGYNKIKNEIFDYYSRKLGNYIPESSYFSIDDLGEESNWVKYSVEIQVQGYGYKYFDGLYKNGQIYDFEEYNQSKQRISDIQENNGELLIITQEYDEETYINYSSVFLVNKNNKVTKLDYISGVKDYYELDYFTDNYIIITSHETNDIILKKNSNGEYNLINHNLPYSYRVTFSDNGELWTYDREEEYDDNYNVVSSESKIYREFNGEIVQVAYFPTYLRHLSVYNQNQIAGIFDSEVPFERYYSNTTTNEGSQSENGWVLENGKWYYYENGTMKTGWLNLGGKWYYLNESGVMETGWLNLGGTWYYLYESGVMATGWLNLGGTWYYLNESGAMETGWLNLGGTWYYLYESGAMATGWLNLGGVWYYLYESGAMASNTIIDGWKIDSNGVATHIK